MKTIALFGGSGGLGKELIKYFDAAHFFLIPISSKQVDLSDKEEVDKFFETHDIDIVINLSGVNYDSFVHKIDTYKARQAIEVNIVGTMNLLSACLKKMRDNKYGRIILISSVLSEKVYPGTGVYSACKSFIDSMARTASAENISKGITVNSIRLGYFDGGMCHRIPEPYHTDIRESIGLKRWGKIEELYNTIKFMIDTEYITGQNVNVSGGIL
jgi:acetoacetyl-CoA reductase